MTTAKKELNGWLRLSSIQLKFSMIERNWILSSIIQKSSKVFGYLRSQHLTFESFYLHSQSDSYSLVLCSVTNNVEKKLKRWILKLNWNFLHSQLFCLLGIFILRDSSDSQEFYLLTKRVKTFLHIFHFTQLSKMRKVSGNWKEFWSYGGNSKAMKVV